MKIYNTNGEELTLTKTTLSMTIQHPLGAKLAAWPCTNVLELSSLANPVPNVFGELRVPVVTQYADWPKAGVCQRLLNRKQRSIGCQHFDKTNWDKIMRAVKALQPKKKTKRARSK